MVLRSVNARRASFDVLVAVVTATVYSPEFVVALGYCPACYIDGRHVPAVQSTGACMMHLRTLPRRPVLPGQTALLDVAPVPRSRRPTYETGQQRDCVLCVAAGKPDPTLGEDQRTPGDPRPLCIPCWTGETKRSAAGSLSPAQRAALDALAASFQEPCGACGRTDGRTGLGAVRVKARTATEERPCWRCGYEPDGFDWLGRARATAAADQAAALREVERAGQLSDAECEARAVVAQIRADLADLQTWLTRLQGVVDDLPRVTKTGSGGALQVTRRARRRARPVVLIADVLARLAREREAAGNAGGRGRPPLIVLVLAVMALDADIASGRRSMPGLSRAAWLAGVSETTVTNAFRKAVALKWAVKRVAGGKCTLLERRETGRSQNRSTYDLRPPHKSRFDQQPFLGAAAALVAQLLTRAQVLVDEARAELAAAQAAADKAAAAAAEAAATVAEQTAEDLAWRADLVGGGQISRTDQVPSTVATVTAAWAGQAAQAAEEARRLRGLAVVRATVPTPLPTLAGAVQRVWKEADRTAWRTAEKATEQAIRLGIICDPPLGTKGERFTSCLYLGLVWTPRKKLSVPAGRGRPLRGRGAGQKLNSRPSGAPTEGVPTKSQRAEHPRTDKGWRATEQPKRRPAAWSWWAYPVAVRLMRQLDVLRDGDVTAAQVAGVLGPRLSPDWTPEDVVQLIERYAGVRSLLRQGDSYAPLRYLKALLDRALTNPDAHLAARSPIRDRMLREDAVRRQARAHAERAARHERLAVQDAAAAAERAGAGTGRAAARAIAAAAAAHQAPEVNGWPQVIQPGVASAGKPELRHGRAGCPS